MNFPKPLVAIIGRPNVGKSRLFNRLVGRRQALVQDRPGVTRDRQYEAVHWDGLEFNMMDTGGFEIHPPNSLQAQVTKQAKMGMDEANLILLILDARAGLTAVDREWVDETRKLDKAKMFVINKVDSQTQESLMADFHELGVSPFYAVSAETGWGIGEMLDAIVKNLKKDSRYVAVQPSKDEGTMDDGRKKISQGTEDLHIAILGRPNVGKSTLLNRLVGEDRAVVHDVPGTTMDSIHSDFTYDGRKIYLVDTAGIRKRKSMEEALEKFSIMKSLQSMEEACFVFLLLDATEGLTNQDLHVAGAAINRAKPVLFLVNKSDLVTKNSWITNFKTRMRDELKFGFDPPFIFISAKTGKNVDKIMPTLLRIEKQYQKRVLTSELNRVFERIIKNHPLPVHAGKNIKIFYATQIGVAPPTFIIFSNEPKKIHFSYQRYLVNSLREVFGFKEIPVKIFYRKR